VAVLPLGVAYDGLLALGLEPVAVKPEAPRRAA